jgi:sulfate adenylyltransferase subunit 2
LSTSRALPTVTHLDELESEAVHIFREVAAELERPVLLFSGGKDSIVLLRLAEKAFRPGRFPFPVMHVDTGHNFPEVVEFRDRAVERLGADLIVASVQDSIDQGRVSEETGPRASRNRLQTVTLLDAIEEHGFKAAFGGARRDEEKSRAKERVFSFRSAGHRWEPRRQRPEMWQLLNGRLGKGETVRVFPLSNWTEGDVWRYIQLEKLDVVPLYFAAERPVVSRNGQLLVVADERMRFEPGKRPVLRKVRFRTLGCWPLTAAIESDADDIESVVRETLAARVSERAGRLIDHDTAGAMEMKKREGYF